MVNNTDTYLSTRFGVGGDTSKHLRANFLDNIEANPSLTKNVTTHLLDRIAKTKMLGVPAANNPFARFTGESITLGTYIQHLQTFMVPNGLWSPTEVDRSPASMSVATYYTSLNDSFKYKTTIFGTEIRKGFVSEEDSVQLVDTLITNMNSSYDWDLTYKFYMQFSRIAANAQDTQGYTGGFYTIAGNKEAGTAKTTDEINVEFATLIQQLVENEFPYLRSTYNRMNAPMRCENPTLILPSVYATSIRLSLSNVFHADYFQLPDDIILTDYFPTPATAVGDAVMGFVIDPRVISYHQRWIASESEFVLPGRFVNYWLMGEAMFDFFLGLNAVAIVFKQDAVGTSPTFTATPFPTNLEVA